MKESDGSDARVSESFVHIGEDKQTLNSDFLKSLWLVSGDKKLWLEHYQPYHRLHAIEKQVLNGYAPSTAPKIVNFPGLLKKLSKS